MNTNDMETIRSVDDRSHSNEGMTRSIYLAMLGAVAMAYDGLDETVERLIRRGEELQGDLQGKAQEVSWDAMTRPAKVGESVQMVGRALRDQLDIPSKTEIDAMNVKLNILMRKLDDLTMRSAEVAASAPDEPVTPPHDAGEAT
jgi:polyhydroxyalkanoate synthesis regulator phasin